VRDITRRSESLSEHHSQMHPVAYRPLGRGFLAGRFRRLEDLAPEDCRRRNPRFQGGAFERNVALADRVRALAATKGCTPAQLALAWLLTRDVVPIPGRAVRTAGGKHRRG
jgi:aryl-alcohol dehydrogenase-like predicted oxidoreductase